MKKVFCTALICLFCGLAGSSTAWSAETELEATGRQVVEAALARLGVGPETGSLACLTNAGFARYNGNETRIFYDIIAKYTQISLGRGNLLPVHCRPDEPLWFAFVHRKDSAHLPLIWVTMDGDRVLASAPVDAHIVKHRSFEPFRALMGRQAFTVVSLANGWSDGMPRDLMAAACFHDHFCCGVASGYFTARFITEHLPLAPGERYTYIGVPAWCQDDYILYYLNLTPGKHGYFTMAYPWNRPWQTAGEKFSELGGIIVRFNGKTGQGRVDLLRFDWDWKGFKRFLGDPEMDMNWKDQPWLHAWYNRYLFQKDRPLTERVSVIRSRNLKTRAELDALIRLGANPLVAMLGKDISW